ncbi:exported hypothetical protein [Nitrospina gracilis 3/211]|uniref:Lipoprotein n=1 Tax=Nitrospina gracilis (strain 3/211) TaxID=1266370 RepID=M1YGI9_NITG3|nr:exported hypothetical protein [Nitrospina gracilis 3/211]
MWQRGAGFLLTCLLALTSTSCGKDEKQVALDDLKAGMAVVEYLTRHDILMISNFPHRYPRQRAKDFVKWVFSPRAQRVWPVTEAMIEANPDLEGWRNLPGHPLLPKTVQLVPNEPDPQYERQVVVKAGEGPDSIIAEAYLSPDTPPVFQREFSLPELQI